MNYPYMRTILILCFSFIISSSYCQQLSLPDLLAVAEMEAEELTIFLTGKGYKLIQADSDKNTTGRYYTSLEKKDSLAMIRSLSWTKAAVNNYEGVLVLYRTYDPKEQADFTEYMKTNNYKLSQSYKTGNSEEFLYSNGKSTIRNSITINRLENNREMKSYSIELGN